MTFIAIDLTLSKTIVERMRRDAAYAVSLFLFLGAFHYVCISQHAMGLGPCGADEAHGHLIQSPSSYSTNHAQLNEAWLAASAEQMLANAPSSADDSLEVYELPVVVHVIHRGSPIGVEENISDAQIHSAIAALNEDFRKMPGTNGDGLGVDVGLEFTLAKRTPSGEPTTGIVRVDGSSIPGYSEMGIAQAGGTNGADEIAVKGLTSWLGDDYVNVFVVPEINDNDGAGGIQGSAYLGPTGDVRDGITLLYNVIGTVGTLKPNRQWNRTMTHEMGHHLSLFHTFWNTEVCGEELNCNNQGDLICDTPPTLENGSCITPVCPGSQPENYLDYSPTSCQNTFTAGQRARMRTCLETVRSSLLSSLGAQPVVEVDLRPLAPSVSIGCSPTWAPVLPIQNQGVAPVQGVEVRWSVNGIDLVPAFFDVSIPPGMTVEVALPEQLVLGPLTTWTFSVLSDLDGFPANDTVSHLLTTTNHANWTLQLNTDFAGYETSWSLLDSTGVEVWGGGPYGLGFASYELQACIAPGCYVFRVEDEGGDGFASGGFLTLQTTAGDTLAQIPASSPDFGDLALFDVCAESSSCLTLIDGVDLDVCHDFNLNGLCDENEVLGCTYEGSANYNASATLDDGSCVATCPGDLNGDGLVQLNDLLDFLIAFGQPCSP